MLIDMPGSSHRPNRVWLCFGGVSKDRPSLFDAQPIIMAGEELTVL